MRKERLGWLLAALAVIALLAAVRLPAPKVPVVITADSEPAAVEAIPAQRGEYPVNTADAKTLDALPHIGVVLSQAIVDEREAQGPYFYPEDLLMVRGIGEKTLEKIYALVDLRMQDEGSASSGDTGG